MSLGSDCQSTFVISSHTHERLNSALTICPTQGKSSRGLCPQRRKEPSARGSVSKKRMWLPQTPPMTCWWSGFAARIFGRFDSSDDLVNGHIKPHPPFARLLASAYLKTHSRPLLLLQCSHPFNQVYR